MNSGLMVVLVVAAVFCAFTPSAASGAVRRHPRHAPVAAAPVDRNVRYPNPKLPEGNTTVLAVGEQDDFLHVFALGADGALYHKYQPLNQDPTANWTEWIMRAKAPAGSTWDADPAVGVNPDGSMDVFIREAANLDLWQLYQTDASDPNAWSQLRECTCVTMPCNDTNPDHYWNIQPVFPTSDVTITNGGPGGALRLYYRGFDGGLYMVDSTPGSNHQYGAPKGLNTILE